MAGSVINHADFSAFAAGLFAEAEGPLAAGLGRSIKALADSRFTARVLNSSSLRDITDEAFDADAVASFLNCWLSATSAAPGA